MEWEAISSSFLVPLSTFIKLFFIHLSLSYGSYSLPLPPAFLHLYSSLILNSYLKCYVLEFTVVPEMCDLVLIFSLEYVPKHRPLLPRLLQ